MFEKVKISFSSPKIPDQNCAPANVVLNGSFPVDKAAGA